MQITTIHCVIPNRALVFVLNLQTKKPSNRISRLAEDVNVKVAYHMQGKFRDGVQVNYEIRLRWFSSFIFGFISDDSIVVDALAKLGEMAITKDILTR